MKTTFIKILNRQIVFLLSLLGFSMAANPCAAQYGVPVYYLDIKGVVLSENNIPVKNIGVTIGNDTAFSDSAGYYYYSRVKVEYNDDIKLKFRDIDGNVNGSFWPRDTTILFKPPERIRTVDMILKKKD
jgi:putative lipoprotein (rSAM/lipoprotein system)